MTDLEAIEAFLSYLRAGRISASTQRIYRSHLTRLNSALPSGLLAASHGELAEYLGAQNLVLKPESMKCKRAVMGAIYRWLVEEDVLDADPARRLPTVRVPKSSPKPVPEDVLARALREADEETRFMLLLGAYAGLRRAEIAGLHSEHVSETHLRITGKGGRTRAVPVHPFLRPYLGFAGWAFPAPRVQGAHIIPDTVGERAAAALGVPFTTHCLRHRFATQAYRASHDLRAVQTLMGHSSPDTTARYIQVGEDSLRDAVLALA
ncbi:MAG: tyrosine-type recombinase/integrase [Actinomycetota bacterium]|nr:tyrosine-type recombinase/integrase [Actinomycetota bacterium]